jgi:hypothetical protein
VSAPPGQPATPGFLQLFPVYLRQSTTVTGLTFSFLPWGSPGVSAAGGMSAEGEPLLVLAYEWPIPWLRPAARLDKADLEAIHLSRFATDHRLALGAHPYVNATGGDAPDFTLTLGDGASAGLDCVALAVQERRGAHALFVNLRRRILQEHGRFSHLGGFMVYLWWPTQDGIALPFRPNDDAALDELLTSLASYRPTVDSTTIPGGGLPAEIPDFGQVSTPSGASFYAVPFRNAVPDTAFRSFTGFDLGFAYTTEHTASTTTSELQRRIDQHDKPGVDWLLVTAGGPSAEGLVFPSETLVARFLTESALSIRPPQHISRIALHIWETGEAFDLLPTAVRLFGPLYAGSVAPHKPIQATA